MRPLFILLLLFISPVVSRAEVKFTILPGTQTGLKKMMEDWKALEAARGNNYWWPWGIKTFQLTPTTPAFFATMHGGEAGSILIKVGKGPDGSLTFTEDKQLDNRQMPAIYKPVIFDFDNDGFLDVLSIHGPNPHIRNVNGTLTVLPRYNIDMWNRGTIGDANGDGYLDYWQFSPVLYGKMKRIQVTNNKNLTFTRSETPVARPAGLPPGLTAKLDSLNADTGVNNTGGPVFWEGDFDGDGDSDLMVRYWSVYSTAAYRWGALCLRNAAGNLEDATPATTFAGLPEIPPRDIDGDGRLDIFTTQMVGAGLYLQKQPGVLTKVGAPFTPFVEQSANYIYEIKYADLDRDGDTDVMISNARGGELRVIEQTAPGVFATKFTIHHWDAEGWDVIDLDGDGDLEIVVGGGPVRDPTLTEVSIYRNEAAFTPTPIPDPIPIPLPIPVDDNKLFLPKANLDRVRQLAVINHPKWKSYKDWLDKYLLVPNVGGYEGSALNWVTWYALGYQVLKDSDPATASKYADKAMATMRSALADFQLGTNCTKQFLARGDGQTKAFRIPNADFVPSSLKIYLSAVTTKPIVRNGKPSPYYPAACDPLPVYASKVLKVSNTSDGAEDWAGKTNWLQNPNMLPGTIEWIGPKPADKATYHLTYCEPSNVYLASIYQPYTVSGTTFTFATAPRTDQAVFVEYVFGNFSQTSEGLGGFNSIAIEHNYPSRYLGKNLALALDWLDGYAGFMTAPSVTWYPPLPPQPTLRSDVMSMLVRWNDYLKDHGYSNAPLTNYGLGSYVSRIYTGLVLDKPGRDPVSGQRIIGEVLAPGMRPTLTNFMQNFVNGCSLKGGYYHEGWNYGNQSTQNIIISGLALEQFGKVTATEERQYANECIQMLTSGSPHPSTEYNGGELYKYPFPFPSDGLWQVLSHASNDPKLKSYAHYARRNYDPVHIPSVEELITDLLFDDTTAPAAFWNDRPLNYFAVGGGLQLSRSDWGATPVWLASHFQNMTLSVGHDQAAPGHIQIMRGKDDLLVNANAVGLVLGNNRKSRDANLVYIEDSTPDFQFELGATAGKYTLPGVQVLKHEETPTYSYIHGDTKQAYHNFYTNKNPVSELNREVLYVNPDKIFVYDRVTKTNLSAKAEPQWHFLGTSSTSVAGDTFSVSSGASKLFCQTFSAQTLNSTLSEVPVGLAKIKRVRVAPTTPINKTRYTTVFQVTPSTTEAKEATVSVRSDEGQMEGVAVGKTMVLFSIDGTIPLDSSFTYTAPAGVTEHFLAGMTPGSYEVSGSTVETTTGGLLKFSAPAGQIQVGKPKKPPAPEGLNTVKIFDLFWNPVPGAAKYKVYIQDQNGAKTEETVTTTSIKIPGPDAGGFKDVYVTTIDSKGMESVPSKMVRLQ